MANQKQRFGYAVIITASVAYACGGGGGGGGGGCTLFEAPKAKVVYCNDAQGTVLQWNEFFCAATPAEVCSVYFHGDLNHDGEYPDATIENAPEGGSEGFPVPSCVCDYGNVVSDACIDGQNQDSTPTTSAGNDETGDTPEPTGGDDPEVYICLKADEKCAKVNYAFSPLLDDWSECWSDPPPCVEATSQADAIKQCEKKCVDRQGEIAAEVAKYNADEDNDDDKIIKLPLDCKYDDDPPEGRPRLATDTDACAPAANNGALPVWGGETPLHAYSGKMSLTDVSGGGAEMANMWGYLSYETFDCKDRSCAIRFDAIEGLADDVSGTYTDRAGAVHHYTLADLDLRLVQAVEGIYYPAEETIEFSDVPFAFILSTTEASADFAALGHIETVAVATRAWGMLTTTGELTLNLSYVGTYGSGTLTLNAH
jgi:hypothetical protein